ncbi:MAG: RAMP superfamily CRISPR-associated protein [Bryobacteraceae bacterium]
MKYRVTCLTPTLAGDGQRLAPIDYMIWKDHVNVLDQRRIFRLLSKGPRLDGYLAQLKKAEKLDFASWGGFAQNYSGRRIPFEHASSIPVWERTHAEHLFIPTFASSATGPYLPGTVIKGALRTGSVFDRWSEKTLQDLAERAGNERLPRYAAVKAEESVLGSAGNSRMRRVALGDSSAVSHAGMKVYLLRVSTMVARGKDPAGAQKFELGWKSVRGSVDAKRIEESTPTFAEMASPGTSFEGVWKEKSHGDRASLFHASNKHAAAMIARHRDYARGAGLAALDQTLADLETKLAGIKSGNACMLCVGWGGGLLGKASYLNTDDESYRKIARNLPFYQRAIQTGFPFPKTRRVIFEGNQPASLPGWVLLEVSE